MTNTPQPGWIGLVEMKGEMGGLIRFGQFLLGDGFSKEEHALVAGFNGNNVEAQPGGAVYRANRYEFDDVLWLAPPDPALDERVAEEALKLVHTPYSFLDYLALTAERLHLPSKRLKARVKSSGHLICSQLADLAAKRAGWHLFDDNRDEGDVTPGDLWGLWRDGTQPAWGPGNIRIVGKILRVHH